MFQTLHLTDVPCVIAGMVMVYAQGMLLSWRVIAWISASYSLIPIILMAIWASESPAWLVSRGKTDKALLSLKCLFKNVSKRFDTVFNIKYKIG